MRFQLLDASIDARFITNVRKAILISLGTEYKERFCTPLPRATYLALETEDGIVGLGEAVMLNELYARPSDCPFAHRLSTELVENYSRICHLRSIYVYPEFRKSFHYLYVALGVTLLEASRGCKFATAVTAANEPGLTQLYCRTGGINLGNFQYPSVNGEWTAFAFRGENLLAHPFSKRVAKFFSPTSFQPRASL